MKEENPEQVRAELQMMNRAALHIRKPDTIEYRAIVVAKHDTPRTGLDNIHGIRAASLNEAVGKAVWQSLFTEEEIAFIILMWQGADGRMEHDVVIPGEVIYGNQ